MKYLLPLLFLVGCETLPEERPKPGYTEMPIIDTYVDDGVKIAPYNEEERVDIQTQIGSFDFFLGGEPDGRAREALNRLSSNCTACHRANRNR